MFNTLIIKRLTENKNLGGIYYEKRSIFNIIT